MYKYTNGKEAVKEILKPKKKVNGIYSYTLFSFIHYYMYNGNHWFFVPYFFL